MDNNTNDFNWKNYLLFNNDLDQNWNEKEATDHYLKYGINENRKYKIDLPPNFGLNSNFNWEIYIKLNNDLDQNWNEKEATDHYLKYGINENRKYKIVLPYNFNWKEYIKLNNDFPKIWNEKEAIDHYLNYGIFEKRLYKSNNIQNIDIGFNLNKNIFYNDNIYNLKNNICNLLYCDNNTKKTILSNKIKNEKNLNNLFNLNILNNKYILVIDFPNLGGGTEFFLNTIISKYKENNTFLILRNFNENIQFNINNDYILNILNENDAINLIKKKKNNISKIFINHIIGHSKKFLNFIMNLNFEITTITHDYFLINKIPQPYYNEHNINYKPKINLNKINKIIMQNDKNLYIYKNFLNEKHDIIIAQLPDYKNSHKLNYTNNSNIVIGIIGNISREKGSKILSEINNYIIVNNLNIKLIIFGKINIDYEYQYPYNNIEELNNLLIIHKPNLLMETSLWNETYSYTLTLSMITQLPILSFKKPFENVIENRLKKYEKKFFFTNIHNFFEIVYSEKQNYFYTISPIIHYNSFWEHYFSN
jgi:hypothetical protein